MKAPPQQSPPSASLLPAPAVRPSHRMHPCPAAATGTWLGVWLRTRRRCLIPVRGGCARRRATHFVWPLRLLPGALLHPWRSACCGQSSRWRCSIRGQQVKTAALTRRARATAASSSGASTSGRGGGSAARRGGGRGAGPGGRGGVAGGAAGSAVRGGAGSSGGSIQIGELD